MWQRIATKVAEGMRKATERSHALGNHLPPPKCPAKRRGRYTLYICCRGTRTQPTTAPTREGHR
jgi:hypothetical protein